MITLTAKLQILPDVKQAGLLRRTMQAYKNACNFVSDYVYDTHDLKAASINKALYKDIRFEFNMPSQMAQSVIRTVIASYKTVLANQHGWIKPAFTQDICDLVWNRDYSLKQDLFSVNTLVGRIKLAYHAKGMEKYFDNTWKFGTATLVCRNKKFYLHIPMSKDIPELQDSEITNIMGIDLGINFLATTYDSQGKTKFYNGRHVKHKRSKYKKTRQDLQKRQTASARRRLKQIGQRENRWMSDVNHRITKALVEQCPKGTLFVLEDLTGVRNATERVCLKDRYVSVSWAFYDFRMKLEYKAKLYGHKVLVVDPRYTSQTCPKCGHVDKRNRNKKLHSFTCRCCGYASNDDRIGAMNLHRKGVEYRSAVMCA